jgi:hypothetical protein
VRGEDTPYRHYLTRVAVAREAGAR